MFFVRIVTDIYSTKQDSYANFCICDICCFLSPVIHKTFGILQRDLEHESYQVKKNMF